MKGDFEEYRRLYADLVTTFLCTVKHEKSKTGVKTWTPQKDDLLFSSSCSLLRGAEEMGLRKPVKPEFGGGTRSFSCEEDYIYENIESELCFFTSQVRVTKNTLERKLVHSLLHLTLSSVLGRRGRALLNTGWTISVPKMGTSFITSTSWRASQSVRCLYLLRDPF